MRAAVLIARSRLRRNITATILLIVLAGLGGSVVLASIAGIRRADAGWAALQREHPEGDAGVAIVDANFEQAPISEDDMAEVRDTVLTFPGVAAGLRRTVFPAVIEGPRHRTRLVAAYLDLDPPVPALSGRPIIVAGRTPRPDRPDEAAINEQLSDILGIGLGSTVTIRPFLPDQLGELEVGDVRNPGAKSSVVRVVAVLRGPTDVLPVRGPQLGLSDPFVAVGPGWWKANGADMATYGVIMGVDLERGVAGRKAFSQQLKARYGDSGVVASGLDAGIGIEGDVRAAVSTQIRAEGQAQAVLALVAALAVLAIVGQTLGRQLAAEGADGPALRALGFTSIDLARAALLRSVVIAAGAGLISAVGTLLLSPFLPRGVSRRVVRRPGLHADLPVLLGGLVAMVLIVLLLAFVSAWRAARSRRPSPPIHRTGWADRAAAAGGPVPSTLGLRMAFDRSVAAVTGRAAVGAGALAIAATVGAASLLGSYGSLIDRPDRLGQRWDAAVGNFSSTDSIDRAVTLLRRMDGVGAVAGELDIGATLGGTDVQAVAYDPLVGTIRPAITAGRVPAGDREVLLGPVIARELGVGIGDRVQLTLRFDEAATPTTMTVVGLGTAGVELTDITPGRTVFVSPTLLGQQVDVAQDVLVQFDDDADRPALLRQLRAAFPETVAPAPVLPRAVALYDQVSYAPIALAGVIGLVATGAVVNALVGSVRRRRRDLAVLKALGCNRRQLRGAIAAQATVWVLVAAVLGVPFGLVVGSVGWRAIARSLGVSSPTVLPVTTITAAVVASVVLANLVALLPGRAASRIPAAEVLRSE